MGDGLSETSAGLLFLVVAIIVPIGIFALLLRILTSRLFLSHSTLFIISHAGKPRVDSAQG